MFGDNYTNPSNYKTFLGRLATFVSSFSFLGPEEAKMYLVEFFQNGQKKNGKKFYSDFREFINQNEDF